jgi:ketosteroid isomerase-like protein
MSDEHVEALHRVAAAANNKDPAHLDALLDPDVVWEPTVNAPDLVGTFHGVDEVRAWFGRWEQAWAEWEWSYPELEAIGDNVFARMHLWGKGRNSGIEAESDIWQVWRFRGAKVVHYRDYESREEALRAASLT